MRRALAALSLLLAPLAMAQEPDPAVLDRALADPTASGLLVVEVVPETQAATLGILPGDILTTYNGKPVSTREGLLELMGDPALPEAIPVVIDRAGETRTFEAAQGRLGIVATPAEKGKPVDPLPPATDVAFDWSRLEAAGEAWYVFGPDDATKVGFEHFQWKVEDGAVVFDGEVAFDGGPDFGVNQFVVHEVVSIGERVQARSARFENPIQGFLAEGAALLDPKAPTPGWEAKLSTRSGESDSVRGLVAAPDFVPVYFIYALARCMPQEKGACWRFTPIEEWSGNPARPSALVVDSEETLRIGDRDVKAWKMAWMSTGQVVNLLWVDADGNVVKADYGGHRGLLSTKEAALEGLHADIHPKTAK